MSIRKLCLIGFGLLAAGCTNYYSVKDPVSGKSYLTTDLKDAESGAVKFTDAKSGSKISIQNSEVTKISKQEFDSLRAK